MKRLLFVTFLLTQLIACSAEVGSDEWCANLKQKPKGEWTANEAKDYAKHCLFNQGTFEKPAESYYQT
jgi:hypothetical protein